MVVIPQVLSKCLFFALEESREPRKMRGQRREEEGRRYEEGRKDV